MLELLIATRNLNKMAEIKSLLAGFAVRLYSLWDLKEKVEIEEDGSTFCQNAALKAQKGAEVFKGMCLGEDSGLEVDYLGGRPGVYSARFAGEGCSYEDNNRKLLQALEGVPHEKRGARFVTCLALVRREGVVQFFEGRVEGMISSSPQGRFGFGYDPVFYLPSYKKTMAELAPEEKNKISHRARALAELKRYLIKEEILQPQRQGKAES